MIEGRGGALVPLAVLILFSACEPTEGVSPPALERPLEVVPAVPTAATPTPRPTQTPWPTPGASPAATPEVAIPMPPPLPEDMPTATPTPGCPIPLLEAEPAEPFDVLAVLEVSPPRSARGASSAIAAAKIRACALGGDAIVVLYQAPRDPRPVPGISPRRGVLPEPAISVAVIRYRQR